MCTYCIVAHSHSQWVILTMSHTPSPSSAGIDSPLMSSNLRRWVTISRRPFLDSFLSSSAHSKVSLVRWKVENIDIPSICMHTHTWVRLHPHWRMRRIGNVHIHGSAAFDLLCRPAASKLHSKSKAFRFDAEIPFQRSKDLSTHEQSRRQPNKWEYYSTMWIWFLDMM